MSTVPAIIFAYILGCFNTGYYLVRLLADTDIRTLASGNTGSRNVGRLLGVKGFVLTFIGDAGKGSLAVWFALYLGGDLKLALAALLAVVFGHIWPVQLGFKGGKGLATFAGGMIIIMPVVILVSLGISVALYPVARSSTKAGLISLACSPVIMAYELLKNGIQLVSWEFMLLSLLVCLLLFVHRSNIIKEFSTHGAEDFPVE